jgi:hypothetical protein
MSLGHSVTQGLRRCLAQTIAAQAILAIERHLQARGFLGTPA